jgi:hypothetical protein
MAVSDPVLQVHLEPREPIEVSELTDALGSLARQYQDFAVETGLIAKAADARLLVSNVAPGSIDISLLPDWISMVTVGFIAPLIDKYELLEKFAKRLKAIIDFFKGESKEARISIKDCDDAINIVKPIAAHGGTQTINVIREQHIHPVIVLNTENARQVIGAATRKKSELQVFAQPENRQRVSMTWNRIDREKVITEGTRSPDRATIEEIDPNPHAVFFTDEMAFLKSEMIADEDNPYQQVYFVDVEISRAAGGRVSNYRIVGFHGKEPLQPPQLSGPSPPNESPR